MDRTGKWKERVRIGKGAGKGKGEGKGRERGSMKGGFADLPPTVMMIAHAGVV